MEEFQIKDGVLLRYRGEASEVTVPDGVTKIGEKAFAGCKSLTSVTVPEGVTEIGRGALDGCIYLGNITLPESLTVIGEGAFCGCGELTRIVLPKGVAEIGESAFMDCGRLEEILPAADHPRYRITDGFLLDQERKTLLWCPAFRMGSCSVPEGTERIGDAAFWGCWLLDRIALPKTLKSIGLYAFESCTNLEEILPEAGSPRYSAEDGFLLDRESKTLLWCSALRTGSCTVPRGVETIGREAFAKCRGLTSVTVLLGVRKIEEGAFAACSQLQRIQLPRSVSEIGAYAFVGCQSLQDIHLPEHLREISANAFLECQSLGSIKVPARVEKIGESAFDHCRFLRNIQLPAHLRVIDRNAFQRCTGLEEILLPEGLHRIGESAFSGCRHLRCVRFPEHMTEIGGSAFRGCTELTEAQLPEALQKIGSCAFENCEKLQRIRLPQHLQEIGWKAFANCTKLEQVLCAADSPRYRLVNGLLLDAESKTLLWCPPKQTGSCTVPDGVEKIGEEAFYHRTGLEEILLPEGVQRIGDGAFNGCQNLRRLPLPESVTEIGQFAFTGCPHLESINLPEGLQRVARGAFMQCWDMRFRMPGKPGARTEEILGNSKPQILIAPQLPCAFLKKEEHRHAALLGFVLTREEELPYIDEAAWREYGRGEKTWLLGKRETDLGVLRWLLREKLLTRAEAEDLLPEADFETRLMLLEYLRGSFPAADEDGLE